MFGKKVRVTKIFGGTKWKTNDNNSSGIFTVVRVINQNLNQTLYKYHQVTKDEQGKI